MKSNYAFFVVIILVFGLIIYFMFASPGLTEFFKAKLNSTSSLAGGNASSSSFFSFGVQSPIRQSLPNLGPGPRSPYYEKNYGALSNGRIFSNSAQSSNNQGGNASQITPPDGFTREQISPYYGKIAISSISFPSLYSPYSRIAVTSRTNDRINVSGWLIQSKWTTLPEIPMAIDDYQAIGANFKNNIVLKANETVNIYSNRSPVGQNFRLNKCTGYLNNYYNFQPALPKSCPALDKGESYLFSSACQNFVRSISGCRVPTANEINRFSAPGDSLCRAFLDKINYGGCYQENRSDPDFFGREWRVWLGQNFDFDRRHDRLFLFDENNLLVDEYSY